MRYVINSGSFYEVPLTSGTVQNTGNVPIEISDTETFRSGIVLNPGEKFSWDNATLYARVTYFDKDGVLAVVPFKKAAGGGGGTLPIATKNTLGGIKVGNGLQIDKNGVLSSTVTPDNSVVTWTAGTAYKVGQYVIYDNKMYECVTANDDDEFDEEKWQVVGGSENVSITDWVAGKKYKADELVIYNNTLYKCITANEDDEFTPAKWQVIGGVGTGIDDWQKNHDYEVGNLVIYDDKIYQCATEHKSDDTFDSEKWTELGDAGNVQAWESGTSYAVDDFAIYDNRLYKCKTANSDITFDPDNWQDMGAIQHTVEAWESGKSYAVGDLVLKDNVIYKCKTANDDTTFDPDNWTVEIDNDKSVTPWVAGTDYAVGKYVVYDNKIWECNTANDDDEFDEEKWTEISAATGIVLEQWAKNTSYKTNQLVEHEGYAYLCLIAHTSTADFDDDFDAKYWRRMPSYVMKGADSANDGVAGLVPQPKKTDVDKFLCADGKWEYARIAVWQQNTDYKVNDIVVYNYVIYMCREAHRSATDFEYNKWIIISGGGNGDYGDYVGHITWQMSLQSNYLKLDGTPLADASSDYAELLEYVQNNNLITADTTDKSLFKYDSTTDVLTLPDYIGLCLQGGNTVEEKEAGLPNIKGKILVVSYINQINTAGQLTPNMFSYTTGSADTSGTSIGTAFGSQGNVLISSNASNYNPIYSDTVDTVQPPAITLIPQIRYKYSGIIYSTEEQRIGTWIDGKPLYRRVFTGTAPSSANVYTNIFIDPLFTNVDMCYVKDGYIKLDAGFGDIAFYTINESNDSAYSSRIFISCSESSIRGAVGQQLTSRPLVVIVEYTKTTD